MKTTVITLGIIAVGCAGLALHFAPRSEAVGKVETAASNTEAKEAGPGLKVWTTEKKKPEPAEQQQTSPYKEEIKTSTEPPALTIEELQDLTDEDRQSAVATALANFKELEPVADVQEVKCDGKKCSVDLRSKTTNVDGNFQKAMQDFHQKNYAWLGKHVTYDPSKFEDGQTLQYTFSDEEHK